ncbi:DUF72 domain-containing protein [Gryllotalpicola koreensis]|uniref:DUF72 domain-containing protein n=1 Tax=Gryllotalpicola koreensis TaxID=993086 RepID=A0ABP7ZYX4_9MICO
MPEARALIGTSAWQKDAWDGPFYPSDLAKTKKLAYFAARISTVEVNSTWRGLKTPSNFRAWHDQVPEHFVFAVKAWRGITHDRPLRGAEQETAVFLASGPLLLGEKLGPLLWQFPESFGFDVDVLDGFLGSLPRSVGEARQFIDRHGGSVDSELAAIPDRPLRHSIEVRNAGFLQPGYLELLRHHRVAAVATNSTSRPVIDAVTADFVYVRFDDGLARFPHGQSEEQLAQHAARIHDRLAEGLDVFFYFDDPDSTKGLKGSSHPPLDAIELQRLVGGEPPAPGTTLQTTLW